MLPSLSALSLSPHPAPTAGPWDKLWDNLRRDARKQANDARGVFEFDEATDDEQRTARARRAKELTKLEIEFLKYESRLYESELAICKLKADYERQYKTEFDIGKFFAQRTDGDSEIYAAFVEEISKDPSLNELLDLVTPQWVEIDRVSILLMATLGEILKIDPDHPLKDYDPSNRSGACHEFVDGAMEYLEALEDLEKAEDRRLDDIMAAKAEKEAYDPVLTKLWRAFMGRRKLLEWKMFNANYKELEELRELDYVDDDLMKMNEASWRTVWEEQTEKQRMEVEERERQKQRLKYAETIFDAKKGLVTPASRRRDESPPDDYQSSRYVRGDATWDHRRNYAPPQA